MSSKPTVNYYLLENLLVGIVEPPYDKGEIPDWWSQLQYIDPNDEHEVKEVIRRYIVPQINNMDENLRKRCELSLRYFLTTRSAPFEDLFEALLPPFDPPENPIKFFEWLWEVWYPGEDYHLESPECYIEDNRFEASN